MSTEDCIIEVGRLMIQNMKQSGDCFAVIRPIEKYKYVDFSEVAKHFHTESIDSYTQTDKIVIKA